MIDIKKVISILLVLCTLLSAIPYSAFALSWDGDSAGGSTNAVNGSSTGYVIRSTLDAACVVGYRFSVIDSAGNLKVSKVIDVYRKTSNGNNAYLTSAKFSNKYNKLGIIENKNAKLTTTANTANCYKETYMGFVTALPDPSGVETWQMYETNINRVLSALGVGSVANMVYGDKVLVEPLFDVCLAGEYQALTVSEIAYCGRSVLGGYSTGGTSNGTSSTWGFIANYTNRIWPNKLFTPDGQGLWDGVATINSYSKETFNNIMNKGYGIGIAYTEKTNSAYNIKFDGNGATSGSTASMSMAFGVAKNLTANGFSKTGNAFVEWNTKADGSGTSYTDQQSVKDLTLAHGATVTLYAQWKSYVLSICYHSNGGSTSSNLFKLVDDYVYWRNLDMKLVQDVGYDDSVSIVSASDYDLYKMGYSTSSWTTQPNGGMEVQYDSTKKTSDFVPDISTGNRSITLYAKWNPILYTIKFHGNESTSGSMLDMNMTYDVAKTLPLNTYEKSGYHFTGWNTKEDGSGESYYNQQSVINLSATQGAVIDLYAQWDTNSYIIAFDGNDSTGGNTSSMTMKFDETKDLNANGYIKTGYSFSKWNTSAGGSGTDYSDRQSVNNLTTVNGGTFNLYAQWTPNTYTIKFNGNGNTSGSTTQMSMTYDVSKNLTANGFNKTGYIFDGWNTNSSGTGNNYTDKQSVKNMTSTNGATINLYAKWKPITYTIKFDGNGATSGSTASMSMTYDVAKNLTANGFKRTSYNFKGWNTKADGSGTNYTDKQSVKNLTTSNGATITLYAKWEYDPVLVVEQCSVYEGAKSDKTTLFGYTRGNVFDDYVYKTDYPVLGDTIWYNIYFPAEPVNIKVRQYVRYKGGSWTTRDVTLSSSDTTSQYFPIQFTGDYKTVPESIGYYEIEVKTDWIDASGNILKSGITKTFYIPVKPVAYRYRVEARGYESVVVAYNGMDGSSGNLYSGQHVKLAYKFKGANTWNPIEYLRGALYYHNGTSWVNAYKSNDGYDVARNKAILSKNGVTTLNSSLNTYTIPKTSQNKLRFNLITWWMNDKEHTEEASWIELPVVPCDLQLDEIKLYDASTNRELDPNKLEAGQIVKVRYIYYNNTDSKVYVESYNDSKERIGNAVYSIPAKSYAGLWGETITVPNERTFTIWGGIYQEGMGIYNTDYEANGTNNEKTLTCKVNHPLKLQAITPNADYRENTEVITSYWLKNSYSGDYTPAEDVSIKFCVYKGSNLIYSYTKTKAVVPGNLNNLIYFKWKVPIGFNNADVKITAEIVDDGVSYNKVTKNYSTIPYKIEQTPDTQFERKGPSGFSIPADTYTTGTACEWWEYTYSNGKFIKTQYYTSLAGGAVTIEPENKQVATQNGYWYLNSGYGITLSLNNKAQSTKSDYATAPESSYTLPQYGVAYFPEYGYSKDSGKITTLNLSNGKWIFSATGSYGNVHFTPLWYPDGNYIVRVELSDLWTPVGMMKQEYKSNKIIIKDSAYDDWYVGR